MTKTKTMPHGIMFVDDPYGTAATQAEALALSEQEDPRPWTYVPERMYPDAWVVSAYDETNEYLGPIGPMYRAKERQ